MDSIRFFSYIFSAGFVKITSFFTSGEQALLIAARMVNVLLGTGFCLYGAADRTAAVSKAGRMVFTLAVTFLPGCLFVFSYVNTDGLALLLDGPDHSDVGAGAGKRLGNQDDVQDSVRESDCVPCHTTTHTE